MYVQSLHLENIKAFDKLDLDFTRTGGNIPPYAGLNVFVGGNSSGKSTLLKCIAMALSGPPLRTNN
jgi:DNA repair exonuclease SbcCD ATPase subunit